MYSYRYYLYSSIVVVLFVSGCATNTNREDIDNDCDHARAFYEEMQESARLYYALGTTSVAEIAVAERRVKKAKEAVGVACGEQVSADGPTTTDSQQK